MNIYHAIAAGSVLISLVIQSNAMDSSRTASRPGNDARLETNRDPRVERARSLKDLVLRQQRFLMQQQEEIFRLTENRMKQLDPETLENAQSTLDGFRELTRTLFLIGDDLILQHTRFGKSMDGHENTLKSAAEAYLAAAQAAREWAKEAEYDATKKDYIVMGETWEYLATRLSQNAQLVGTQAKELDETFDYLEETVTFLKRLYGHLSTLFRLEELSERQRYLKNLKTYIQQYQRFESLFRQFHGQLTQNALRSEHFNTRSEELPVSKVAVTHANAELAKGPSKLGDTIVPAMLLICGVVIPLTAHLISKTPGQNHHTSLFRIAGWTRMLSGRWRCRRRPEATATVPMATGRPDSTRPLPASNNRPSRPNPKNRRLAWHREHSGIQEECLTNMRPRRCSSEDCDVQWPDLSDLVPYVMDADTQKHNKAL